MSLLDEFKESFVILNKTTQNDGEGGLITTYTDGATIQISVAHDNSLKAKTAEAEGVNSTYTFIFDASINLDFPDILRRVSDSQIFRVTSNAKEKKTPSTAGFNLKSVSAEKWAI